MAGDTLKGPTGRLLATGLSLLLGGFSIPPVCKKRDGEGNR